MNQYGSIYAPRFDLIPASAIAICSYRASLVSLTKNTSLVSVLQANRQGNFSNKASCYIIHVLTLRMGSYDVSNTSVVDLPHRALWDQYTPPQLSIGYVLGGNRKGSGASNSFVGSEGEAMANVSIPAWDVS